MRISILYERISDHNSKIAETSAVANATEAAAESVISEILNKENMPV